MEIPDIGFYYPRLFDKNYYTTFLKEHNPQPLSESNKDSVAYRKGVYITDVSDDLKFHVLRCSSNLHGATENLTATDREIITLANQTAKKHYPDSADLNHVLAQVYYNHTINSRDRRAKIPAHSDKTEDMPRNGLIAFCTFYDPIVESKKYHHTDTDVLYKKASALTSMKFINKTSGKTTIIPLQPNSLLLIDLNTNRTHTHETIPPLLASSDVPTRLGYVIRCSDQKAKFSDGQTYLLHADAYTPLLPPTTEKIKHLKELYLQENLETTTPDYGFIDFSLNQGDYLRPLP